MIVKDPLDESILTKVAVLHRENIRTGFISSLGDEFLKCMYKAISLEKRSVLLVHIENNEVAGFISGTENIHELRNMIRKKCIWVLLKLVIKFLANPISFRKFIETYKYSSASSNVFPFNIKAELLSIVVNPNYRKKGIARNLYLELLKFFKSRGVRNFKIIVGAELKGAQRFYERMGAEKIAEFELHKGNKSYIYIQKILGL